MRGHALAALLTPAHTELANERVHFDPVRVFLGPAPGWKGPVLGPTGAVTAAVDPEDSNSPRTHPRVRGSSRPIRHPAAEVRAQKQVAEKTVNPKTDTGAGDK